MAAEDRIDLCYDAYSYYQEAPERHLCGDDYSVIRQNKKTGRLFVGCKDFPKCRYSSPLGPFKEHEELVRRYYDQL